MRLKHCICCLLLFITTFAMGQTNTDELAWTFKRSSEWQDTTVRLIVADAPKADGNAFQEVKAKWATYKLNPEFRAKFKPSAPYTAVADKLYVVMFQDPHSKKIVFIRQGFYVSSPAGMKAYALLFHQLWHSESFLELAESKGEAADIEYFEKTFNAEKEVSKQIGPYEERVVFFKHALPAGYFSDSPHPGGRIVQAELTNAEVTKGVLRLDLWNPIRKIPASVWFDLETKKVIRSVADGVEMAITDEKAYYAVQKEKNQ